MKKILLLVSIVCMYTASFAQVEMVKKIITGDSVEILLPSSFEKGNSSETGVSILWEKKDGVSLEYHFLTDSITDNETSLLVDRMLKESKQDYKNYKYIDDGIHLQNWKNIGYLKFSSKEKKRKDFNYIFFISVNDRPLVFTFTCPDKQRKKWEPVADSIANSLRVKE